MIGWAVHHLVSLYVVTAATVIVGVVCTEWLVLAIPATLLIMLGGYLRWRTRHGTA